MPGSRPSQRNLSTDRSAGLVKATSATHAPETNLKTNLKNDELAQSDPPQSELSKRELQIVELVSAGMTNQEISEKLEISKRTVDNHVSNILSKTATGNRVALVRWALQSGKVCIDELNCCHLPESHLLSHLPES